MMTPPRAVLFDMDGTLTEPLLDFELIRRDMGIASGRPILEALAEMEESARRTAQEVLHQHEERAAAGSKLNPGCGELLDCLKQRRIAAAVITRNSRASVRTILDLHRLHFDVLITREDGKFKPDPAPLLEACRRLGVATQEAWMVGDGQYDVEAGRAAGARTLWLSHGRPRPFAAEPWRTVRDLAELTELLRGCLK
jgi:HAD superfamily hydrolase (TIGR01509 family)